MKQTRVSEVMKQFARNHGVELVAGYDGEVLMVKQSGLATVTMTTNTACIVTAVPKFSALYA